MTIAHLYTVALSFAVGIFVSSWLTLPPAFTLWLFFMATVVAVLWRREKYELWLFVGLGCFAFALGALRVDVHNQSFEGSPLAASVGEVVTITGVVATEPDIRAVQQLLTIETDTDRVLVSVDRHQSVAYGDTLRVTGKLAVPESFVTDFGREFNYAHYLKVRGILYTISFAEITKLGSGEGSAFVSGLLSFKQDFLAQVNTYLPEPAAGLGAGLLLGVKQALGEELETAFRKTGIIHVVVLSGYNVMLVVAFVLFVLGRFMSKRPKLAFGLFAIFSFALLVGLSATVVRACIMAALLLIAQATGRLYFVLRGLLLAGLLMIALNPLLLVYDVGFQLSFMATLGLILIAPHIEVWCAPLPNTGGLRTFLTATIATQIAVLPLLLFYIGEFSVVALIVNVLILPMVPIAMLFTFMVGISGFVFPPLASLLAYPATAALSYITVLAEWFAALPFAAYGVPVFSALSIPIFYLLIGVLLVRFHSHAPEFGASEISEGLLRETSREEGLAGWEIVEETDSKTTSDLEVVQPKDTNSSFFR